MVEHLGRYEIKDLIGRGSFGDVYLGIDPVLEREAAVKVLDPVVARDEDALERFFQEARSLARISHPNVVTVYEIGEVEGRVYIAMEYLPGGSLSDRLAQGSLSVAEALKIAQEIGSGLGTGHAEGLIHRDVKPGNILFDEEGQAVIADFGVARAVQVSSLGTTTQSSGTVGTPFYRPPELWRGTPPPSPATDVYSLACVLYEMLTGEVLFSGDTPDHLITKHLLDDASDLMNMGARQIPESLQAVLVQALAKDPQDRYQGTNSFVQALNQAQGPQEPKVQAEPKQAVDHAPGQIEPIEEKPREDSSPTQTQEKPTRGESKAPVDPLPVKPRMPDWLPWLVIGTLVMIILVMALGGNGNDEDRQLKATDKPMEAAVAMADTPEPTFPDLPTTTLTKTKAPAPSATETRVPTRTPTLEPTLGVGSTMANPVDGAVMVYVPEGEFLTGSEDGDAWDEEKPEHPVWLDAFWIYQTEVTNAQYRQCVEDDACELPGNTTNYQDPDYTDHPVVHVSWYDAEAYCQWAGGQLLTEAQWEKAARGDEDDRRYPWGDQNPTCGLTNFSSCVGGTAPVGIYEAGASIYGALDMAGNVWEWVADRYAGDYYSSSPYENPKGPTGADDAARVVRGGSWYFDGGNLRVSARGWYYPVGWDSYLGFRCLRRAAP